MKKGFTLIEILVVVFIISLLALAVFIFVDPLRVMAESRNARRWSDVNNLSTAVFRYIIEQGGYPSGISTTEKQLGTASSGCNDVCTNASSACLDLTTTLENFLPDIPRDPKGGTAARTYYSIVKSDNNVITIKACNAENGLTVELAR
jgi:prepilin-type N-terminal cleavage/methylation domain-containing protein